jgi:hypothetical protein
VTDRDRPIEERMPAVADGLALPVVGVAVLPAGTAA